MKILRINQHSLRNEGWFEFYVRFKGLVNIYNAKKIGIEALFDIFLPLLKTVDAVLQAIRKSSYTEPLADADKERGDVFKGLEGTVKSMMLLPDANKKEAARRIDILLSGYRKNILKGDYHEESAAIYNLLQDISYKYENEVELLELTVWISALTKAEKNFQTINKKREDESRDKPKDDLAKYRREIDSLYVNMANVIDAGLVAEGLGGDVVVDPQSLDYESHDTVIVWNPEVYGNMTYNFVVAWNEVVKKYRDDIARRAGIRKKGEDTLDPEEE
jgi:hypothetical protein